MSKRNTILNCIAETMAASGGHCVKGPFIRLTQRAQCSTAAPLPSGPVCMPKTGQSVTCTKVTYGSND